MALSIRICCGALLALSALLGTAAQAQDQVTVNNKSVSLAKARTMLGELKQSYEKEGRTAPPNLESRLRDRLVMDEILVQEAERLGLASNAEFKEELEAERRGLLAKQVVRDYLKKNPIKDADVEAAYKRLADQSKGSKEYRLRHIVVSTPEKARELLTMLRGGANFGELAKTHSIDKESAPAGGVLEGYLELSEMQQEIAGAVAKLGPGQVSEPIATKIGVHVVAIEDSRDIQLAPLAQVKGALVAQLEREQLSSYLKELRAKTKTNHKFSD